MDRQGFRQVNVFLDQLESNPIGLGYPLNREFEGCTAAHVGHGDDFRVIWKVGDPEPDHQGGGGDEVVTIAVVRAYRRRDARGRSIYELTRPPADDPIDDGDQ